MALLNYDFDWGLLWHAPYGTMLLGGIWTTIHLSLFAWCMAVTIGIIIGVLRVVPHRGWRLAGSVYVQVFRNTPLLVHLFFWYFAAPLALPKTMQLWLYDNVGDYAYYAGVIGLGTYTASRVAEQVRAGFLSIPNGQYCAAYATGLRTAQVYRFVIIPMPCASFCRLLPRSF